MNRFFTFTFFIMFAVQAYPQKVESIAVGPSSRVYEVIRPNEEKISISNGLTTQFLDVPLFKGDYVYGRVALDVNMFGLDLLYKTVCYNWKTGKLCLAIDGNIKNIGDDKAIIEEYHTKYGNNKIPVYGCYDLSSLNSATVSINRLSDSKLSLWCLGALFDCCISRDKPFHPLTPPSDLRQYAVENRQEIRISQSLY